MMPRLFFVLSMALLTSMAGCKTRPDLVATHQSDAGTDTTSDAPSDAPPVMCCPVLSLCGAVCCDAGQVCGDGTCTAACPATESACGDTCCGADESCVEDACVPFGASCFALGDCPEGTYCETTVSRCLPDSSRDATCEYRPPGGALEVVEEWAWTGDVDVLPEHRHVVMTPIVANLDDDNGDGLVDQRDTPDVLFASHAGRDAPDPPVLRAVSGVDGARKWPLTDPGYRVSASGQLAVGELVADSPGLEIVACSPGDRMARTAGFLLLIAADGTLLRSFDTPGADVPCDSDAPAIGDMDGDGVPEIAVRHVIARADGTVVARIRDERSRSGVYTALVDADGDDDLELVSVNGAYEMDGTPLWERLVDEPGRPAFGFGYLAVGDLDLDGSPELVTVLLNEHALYALDPRTGDTLFGPIDINPAELADIIAMDRDGPIGGGPPTLSNMDDDPEPEIAVAGAFTYAVFEPTGEMKWWSRTSDLSSRTTGSSIFDFDGDGIAEALYADERTFRVYRATDGVPLLSLCNTSTTQREYPVVADVDGDNQAEIVVVRNDNAVDTCLDGSPSAAGVRVFGHPRGEWARTRAIWNQHTYHVTNVNTDGTIPTRERPHWREPDLNAFRQNVLPAGTFDAPDLMLSDFRVALCECETTLAVTVTNGGSAGAPARTPVSFYVLDAGGRRRIGGAATTTVLLPGQSVTVEMTGTYALDPGTPVAFDAVVNDTGDGSTLNECRADNNAIGVLDVRCESSEP